MRPLTHRIYLLGQVLGQMADGHLRTVFDLSFNEFLLLRGVGSGQLHSQADLKGIVGIGEAGVSRIVSRLVGRGLLKTSIDPRNRRRNMLHLTEAGSDLLERAGTELERQFAQSTERVAEPDEMEVFEKVLGAYLARLGF